MKIRSTKNNLSNHSKVTTHEELKVPKEKTLLCISIGHQELLVFQDKTLEKKFDHVMNQMNILISKSAHTEVVIRVYSPYIINSYIRTTTSSSLPSHNRSKIISRSKTGPSMSSEQPPVTLYQTNKIKF